MKTIEIQPVAIEPAGEEFRLFPDYLINQLTKRGIGRIEADRALQHDGRVDFVFTSHRSNVAEVIASIPEGFFRPLLARFGPRCGSDNMLYCGHTLFACEQACEGEMRPHRFSLFICNEPSMGVWMKLYLYCIDGVWPVLKETRKT